ncbi:MAG: three-Cys-motif partner protein TcmP [Chthonomonadales bacterium]|nr:three-Cys-motif partner protein TcmP [Chthonomonadales bacterium]
MARAFGGPWTEDKLEIVERYLEAYMTIMRGNEKARRFTTTYVDAFAGPGLRQIATSAGEPGLFDGQDDGEITEFYRGSAYRAMSISLPFDRYVFVDSDRTALEELKQLIRERFSDLKATVHLGDANEVLPRWVKTLSPFDRAVVFLDPYAMQVEWNTIEVLSEAKGLDLWLLVPIGALMRLLPHEPPPSAWVRRLDRFFGSHEWYDRVYMHQSHNTLFGPEENVERLASPGRLAEYMLERLSGPFKFVLKTPYLLYNSKGACLFMLCFAATNKKGGELAVKIAGDIAGKHRHG